MPTSWQKIGLSAILYKHIHIAQISCRTRLVPVPFSGVAPFFAGWHNADPIRRHYYDSGANEGIGFYAEEMMLQAGFFDDNAQTRETIYSFMRLRALRVEVDVKLALGEFTLQQAADYLEKTVPMDRKTALGEAAMFASTPGQAISYQVGKIQIMELLSDARRARGKDFSMLEFNDFVWNNGNVPIALQRWEMLGDASEVPATVVH